MRKSFIIPLMLLSFFVAANCNAQAIIQHGSKTLVAYFSGTGTTQRVANRIAEVLGTDIYRIEAAEPYASNPYDDSNRIQNEAYNDLRPAVGNLPSAEDIARYDTIFVGSPCWWHQPAMVVCTFLESFDLTGKVIVPFFTYGATTYLNESMHKIYKVTQNSLHIPATLPEDLNPDDITTPGPADDAGIEMPGSANGVEAWLRRIGVTGNNVTGIAAVDASLKESMYDVYALNGTQVLGHAPSLALLASGLYIVNGKKVIVK